ncbi:hypothetical protein ElyMa_000503900 [Elysia marginata]|uniref:Uncharacterized protein n=1 Tax=Elysia marginata TaxID=1093978 RepID=A0AAV4FX03_9GAST|nr:hypothetical protein ElyMa_000503900 [Elysia marginata]
MEPDRPPQTELANTSTFCLVILGRENHATGTSYSCTWIHSNSGLTVFDPHRRDMLLCRAFLPGMGRLAFLFSRTRAMSFTSCIHWQRVLIVPILRSTISQSLQVSDCSHRRGTIPP